MVQTASYIARWSFIAWMVLFFGVIVPGHQRGAIKASGSPDAMLAAPSCPLCASLTLWGEPGNDDQPGQPSPSKPTPTNCAICMLVAKLDRFVWTQPRAFVLERLPWFAPQTDDSIYVPDISLVTFLARGPPTV